jgi:hypothetical protein
VLKGADNLPARRRKTEKNITLALQNEIRRMNFKIL